jgi:hypothetical protein
VRALIRRLTCLAAMLSVLAGMAQAQTPNPSSATSSPAAYTYCPIGVREEQFKGHPGELLFTLWSDDTAGNATGTITAYVSGQRYQLGFANAIAGDDRNADVLPTPIVVAFPQPVTFESAYVQTLGNVTCPVHEPSVDKSLEKDMVKHSGRRADEYPQWARVWPAYLTRAASIAPLPAPVGIPEEKPACAAPYVSGFTKHAVAPNTPLGINVNTNVFVRLMVDPDGQVVMTRVDRPSQYALDAVSRAAVLKSTFSPRIYRCEPVSGTYFFIVKFSAT